MILPGSEMQFCPLKHGGGGGVNGIVGKGGGGVVEGEVGGGVDGCVGGCVDVGGGEDVDGVQHSAYKNNTQLQLAIYTQYN